MNNLANKEASKHNPLATGMICVRFFATGVRRLDSEEGKKRTEELRG